ncbi:MAG: hypothetical protein U0930_22720 [Pirellulales bacterium]
MGERGLFVVIELFIATLGVVVAGIVGYFQATEAKEQASTAIAQNEVLNQRQIDFSKYLNDLDEWRKNPNLTVVRTWQSTTDTIVTVLQNNGGRDVVLMEMDFVPFTPATEPKFGAGPQPTTARGSVDTADRSKVLPIDLSTKDLVFGQPSFMLDPPVIIEPGKSLVIKTKLNPRTISGFLFLRWNGGRTESGIFQSPLQNGL